MEVGVRLVMDRDNQEESKETNTMVELTVRGAMVELWLKGWAEPVEHRG